MLYNSLRYSFIAIFSTSLTKQATINAQVISAGVSAPDLLYCAMPYCSDLPGREVAGGSHRYFDVEAVFRRSHKRLSADLTHHHQGGIKVANAGSINSTHIRFGSDPNGLEGLLDDDDDDGDGYDAGNRSPTYRAKMRKSKQQGQPESEFCLLDMVLDCERALARDGGSVAAAGTMVNGTAGGGGGRWQWGNGAGGRGPAPVVGRKRQHW